MNKHTIVCLLATSVAVTALTACATPQQTAKTSESTQTYVSDGYHKRTQGYDWVAVETTKNADNTLKVKIRSRADKKKPTCTFDGTAYPTDNNLYQLKSGDMTLNLRMTTDSLEIAPAQDSDRPKAMYYCSGGGSLIGTYRQVAKLDRTGLDYTKFAQTLSL